MNIFFIHDFFSSPHSATNSLSFIQTHFKLLFVPFSMQNGWSCETFYNYRGFQDGSSVQELQTEVTFVLAPRSWQVNSGAFSLLFSPTWVNPDCPEEIWGQLYLTKTSERCFPVKIHENSDFKLNSQSVLQPWWKSVLCQSRRKGGLGEFLRVTQLRVMKKLWENK